MKLTLGTLLAILLAAGGFYAGYRWREPEVITKTQTQTQIQEVEKIVTKTVRETVTEPGGTVVVRETITANQSTETRTKATTLAAQIPRPDWSVGVLGEFKSMRDFRPTSAELGYRLIDSLWVLGAYDWKHHGATLGVRYDF